MKISNYKAVTPVFDGSGKRIVYSFRTQRMLLVDDQAGENILNFKKNGYSLELENELIQMKILVPDEENELEEIILENDLALPDIRALNFTIFTSANCQLGCVYCGQSHSPQKLDRNLFPHILKYIEDHVVAMKKQRIYISWFGGEPLLGLDAIVELTPGIKAIAEKHNCAYDSRITTNGLLLNKKNYKILRDNNVRDISISLDGISDDHDKRRSTKGGNGSYDVIYKNLSEVFSEFDTNADDMFIRMRINVDQYNKEGINRLLEMFAEQGWGHQINGYDIAPIHSWGNDANFRAMPSIEFAELKLEFLVKLYELGLLNTISVPRRNRIVCNAVTEEGRYMDPNGKLFDCSEFPLVNSYGKDISVGHIINFESDKGKRNFVNWNAEVCANKYPCGTCRILPLCGGGCPKAWREGYEPCPDYKLVIEDLIVLSYLTTKKRMIEYQQLEEPVV